MPKSIRLSAVFALAFMVSVACPRLGRADIMWNVTFQDVLYNTNVGFDDPTMGTQRQNTFLEVTQYLNTVLDENGRIDFTVAPSQMDGRGFLAAAGTFFVPRPYRGGPGTTNGMVFQHATTGIDPVQGLPDGHAVFDFGYETSIPGLSMNSTMVAPAANEFDLFSISLHEVTHSLGFLSLMDRFGRSGISPGLYSVFDDHLVRGATAMDDMVTATGQFVGSITDAVSDDVYFSGTHANAANGGNPVKIFAPNPYLQGSSLSHLVLQDGVMQYSVGPGVARREYTDQELGILADLGWNVDMSPAPPINPLVGRNPLAVSFQMTPAAVPEPSSAVLLGLAALTGFGWRKRRSILPTQSV